MTQQYLTVTIEKIKYLVLSVFILYVFWYQYARGEVSGVITMLGVLMVGFELLSIRRLRYYREISFVFIFLFISVIMGFLFTQDMEIFSQLVQRIIKYCIPMVCTYSYIGSNRDRFRNVMGIIVISITLLALNSFAADATVTATGAISVGDLNTNVFSCYIFIGVMSAIYLIEESNKKLVKCLLWLALLIFSVAQIKAASRRGFLILIFCISIYVHSLIFLKNKNNIIYKILTITIILIGLVIIIDNLGSLMGDTVLWQRFFHNQTKGDQLRKLYQGVAFSLFSQNPIFGNGFGCVQSTIGMYSHSLYFELLACCGLLGTILILFPIMRRCIRFWKLSNNNQFEIRDRMQQRILSIWCIAMLMIGIAVTFIYDADFYLLLAIIAARKNIDDFIVRNLVNQNYLEVSGND